MEVSNFDGELFYKLKKKYSMMTKIGEGGYGEVFAVEVKRSLEHKVVKIVELYNHEEKQDFEKEIQIYSKLHHPNICQLSKSKILRVQKQKFALYELEKMDGDLLSYVVKEGRISNEETSKYIFREICKAVEYLHSQGVAHLDIKSDNILINVNDINSKQINSVKICDFGFARKWDQKRNPNAILKIGMDEMIGTKEYAGPEITNNRKSTVKISVEKFDIYSLGVVLFTMVSGVFPNLYNANGDLIQALPSNYLLQYCSNGCQELVVRMMSSDPSLRPSINEILNSSWLSSN